MSRISPPHRDIPPAHTHRGFATVIVAPEGEVIIMGPTKGALAKTLKKLWPTMDVVSHDFQPAIIIKKKP